MSFCPKCKYEYKEGIAVCPDCDVRLVKELHVEAEDQEDYPVALVTVGDISEADIIKSVLDSAGIPAYVQSHHSAMYTGVLIPERLSTTIFVANSRRDDARAVLREATQA
jgi:hypothetical protein